MGRKNKGRRRNKGKNKRKAHAQDIWLIADDVFGDTVWKVKNDDALSKN